ncbi:Cell cycle control protein [Legionella massiliensis]|uniref:Cell cycle control protein n=1 Tax=Legionella massiliensis TaxID=1034943 RepID=A0A078L0E7_9GAMM|nr:hypothetical protein [Legionella massiliensis]CDZ78631.1 Cell cycle control protein [Legionella massiliensis]CEE14369.1 Regulator of chromosome condensation (RCC1) repeat protein [Legionella massiliensis]
MTFRSLFVRTLPLGLCGILGSSLLHAGIPVWTFSAPNPAQVTVAEGQTVIVQYTVTNQSSAPKQLFLRDTPGLTASSCNLVGKGSTCNLILTVNGSQIPVQGLHSGPVLCEQANPNQCYSPVEQNQLQINHSSGPGRLEASQFGNPVSVLNLQAGDSGTLILTNTGGMPLSGLTIQPPFGWQSYFSNNCPSSLAAHQSCALDYNIPIPAALGIFNPLNIQATQANSLIAAQTTVSLNITVSIRTMGSMKCWGSNYYGQLGSTSNIGTFNPNTSPLDIPTLGSGVIAIAGGNTHTCALLNTGAVKCWGWNNFGQLGSTTNSGTTNANTSPLDVQTLNSGVVAITTGAAHTCALLNTGAVKCWGWNNFGQIGSTVNSGTSDANNIPLDVQTLSSGVVAISAGGSHTCALLDTGAVKCWGWNLLGQLGSTINNQNFNANNIPLDVQTLSSGVVAISAGGNHTCALLDTGAVKCWGSNTSGQLGATINSGIELPNNSPLDVQTLSSGAVAVTTGSSHSCALLDTGAVKCWGDNSFGQLGSTINSGTNNANNSPLDVQTLNSAVVSLAAGSLQTCVLLNTGAEKCWGSNRFGQLGSTTNSGTTNANNSPLDVQTLGAGSTGALSNDSVAIASCAIVY